MKLIDKSLLAAGVLAAGFAISSTAASAQGYVKAFGGLTVPQDEDFRVNLRGTDLSDDSGFNFDNGYVLGIAGGYMVTPNVAVELEYAYRNADAEFTNTGGLNSTTESNAWMVNALYNFTPVGASGAWQPYAGGGLGAADLNVEGVGSFNGGDFDSDYQFAYQLIGGVKYNLPSGWSLNGEARYFGINDQDLENSDFSFKAPYHTFDLLFGASYSF